MSYKILQNIDVIPCLPTLTRGQPSPLKCSPDGKKLLYALGRTVVIRDIVPVDGMIKAQLYTQHQYDVTAVAMAPSGCYMATGDKTGVLRIWACDNPEQILKVSSLARLDPSPHERHLLERGPCAAPARTSAPPPAL